MLQYSSPQKMSTLWQSGHSTHDIIQLHSFRPQTKVVDNYHENWIETLVGASVSSVVP